MEENRDFFKIMQSFSGQLRDRLEKELKGRVVEKQSRYIKILTRLIERAIKEGEVKPLDARKLAIILMGIIHSLTVYWISQKERGSLCRDASLVQEVFSQGVER